MPAAIVTPTVAVFEKETGVKTPVKKLTFSQYKKMIDNAAREFHLEEVQWKRVDKLEEFVDACNDYSIENKTWQRMEKYVAVYLAAGGEADEALDSVLANNLIYSMLPCVAESKKPLDEKFSATLETMFGEGHLAQTLKAIKDEGLGV
jgi:chromosome condensin MukBEF ATPase and DNA-binding subunit MukB